MRKTVAFFIHSLLCIMWGIGMATLPDKWFYLTCFAMPLGAFIVGIWGDGLIFTPKKED